MITDTMRNSLWYAIKEWVEMGATTREFKLEAAECWEQALRDRLESEPKEILR